MATTGRMAWRAPSDTNFAAPMPAWMNLSWLIRTALSFSFLIAFLQYELYSAVTQFLSLACLGLCGLLVLCGRRRGQRVHHVLSGGGLWFTAILFGEVVSYTSRDTYSVLYGLVFAGVFLCARLVVQEIGMPNVVRAYSQAAILTAGVILVSGRRTLLAGESSRFNGGTRAHPNLVAFVLAGFLPVIVWRALEEKGRWRKPALIMLSIATFVFMFLTGSRGSLSAVLLAGGALLFRSISKGWLGRLRIQPIHIIAALILLPLATVFLLEHNRLGHVADYLNDFLSLSSTQRGVKSGLSGRTDIWQIAFRLLRAQNRWLFGFGYRAGDRLVGTIDNGYVQLLFESGLIAGSLIFGSMLRVFFLLWKVSSPRENNAWTRYYMMLWCMMIVYFLNNISTRYLFSFGSPFSLCVLFMMAASRQELIGAGMRARAAQKARAAPRAAVKALAWNRPRD
ncbi:MAG TPA: O-antigen ligase family protein [Acidobacteriaceae bacterium]|jgi:O-antigen ligase